MPTEPNALVAIGRHARLGPLLGALLQALDTVAEYELTPGPDAIAVGDGEPFLIVSCRGERLVLRLLLPGSDGPQLETPEPPRWQERVIAGAEAVDAGLIEALAAAYLAVASDVVAQEERRSGSPDPLRRSLACQVGSVSAPRATPETAAVGPG